MFFLRRSRRSDATLFACVTEAVVSSRRPNEDQDAGNDPLPSAVLREKLQEAQKILGSICTFVSRRICCFYNQSLEEKVI